jgi:hypothetical protein
MRITALAVVVVVLVVVVTSAALVVRVVPGVSVLAARAVLGVRACRASPPPPHPKLAMAVIAAILVSTTVVLPIPRIRTSPFELSCLHRAGQLVGRDVSSALARAFVRRRLAQCT